MLNFHLIFIDYIGFLISLFRVHEEKETSSQFMMTSLYKILRSPSGYTHFEAFLKQEFADENLEFW